MWSRMLAPVLLLPILSVWASAAAHAKSPTGVWLTDTGKGKVHVSHCGKKLCAKIVWLRDPVDERGRPWRDGYNPNPALRKRKIIGLPTFENMRKVGPNLWVGGVYSPEEGKTYENIEVSVVDRRTLKLRGCKVMGIVCGHKLWTRSKHTAKKKKVVAAARQKAKPKPQPRRDTVQRSPAPPVQAAPQRAAVAQPQPGRAPRATAPAPTQQPIREARIAPPRAVASPRPRPAPVASGDGYVVQLAARRSESSAQTGIRKLRRKYPMLQDYEATIQRADLDSGTWFRLRFGTLSGKTEASDLCAELIASGLENCLVRRR